MQTTHDTPRYLTVATCVEDGCCCLDRAGVILYDGPDAVEAERAKNMAPSGYAVEVERIPTP